MPRRPKEGHPLDGAADAAATATRHTRIIPDGAHHSGLGKDYGGMYNPDYQDPITRLRQREAQLVEACTKAERWFASYLERNQAGLGLEFKMAHEALIKALATQSTSK